MAYLSPWRALREGDAICRDVATESLNEGPFQKSVSEGDMQWSLHGGELWKISLEAFYFPSVNIKNNK